MYNTEQCSSKVYALLIALFTPFNVVSGLSFAEEKLKKKKRPAYNKRFKTFNVLLLKVKLNLGKCTSFG